MQGSKRSTFLQLLDDFWSDADALSKAFSTMDKAVSDGVDLIEGVDVAKLFFLQYVEDDLYTTSMVWFVEMTLDLLPIRCSEGDEGFSDTDAFVVPRG